MKKIFFFTLITFSAFSLLAGGGGGPTTAPAACNLASPFCAGSTYTFPNTTGVADLGANGIYDCLGSTPNSVWYYMQISNSGSINININQTSNAGNPIDVDFVMWGP